MIYYLYWLHLKGGFSIFFSLAQMINFWVRRTKIYVLGGVDMDKKILLQYFYPFFVWLGITFLLCDP